MVVSASALAYVLHYGGSCIDFVLCVLVCVCVYLYLSSLQRIVLYVYVDL